jgi:isopentenyl-diphosphate delta-isomerase
MQTATAEEEQVVLVDTDDREQGTAGKQQAHEQGLLHRAVSVVIYQQPDVILLQQRARDKYHSAGQWTNTCCSHPRPGEAPQAAAERRLEEEMGLALTLQPLFRFQYQVRFANGLTEHELDHVFIGATRQYPRPNPAEAMAWRYAIIDELQDALQAEPELYTPWFHHILPRLIDEREAVDRRLFEPEQ